MCTLPPPLANEEGAEKKKVECPYFYNTILELLLFPVVLSSPHSTPSAPLLPAAKILDSFSGACLPRTRVPTVAYLSAAFFPLGYFFGGSISFSQAHLCAAHRRLDSCHPGQRSPAHPISSAWSGLVWRRATATPHPVSLELRLLYRQQHHLQANLRLTPLSCFRPCTVVKPTDAANGQLA
ncbi:hypothetical protein CFRS1_v004468 [Colletotrichum fructicola]|nr:hypothetical protein CFRS1_v004468 [Colletotrichum fructicola]